MSLCTLDAEDALPARAGDLQSCWNEMAGIRGQFQFATEHAQKLLESWKRGEMGPAFQAGDLRLFHTGEFGEIGLTEPAPFPQPRQLHGNPHFLLRLRKSLGEFWLLLDLFVDVLFMRFHRDSLA